MNEFETAAVIGYHRMGATIDEIISITGFAYWKIEKAISDHKNKIEDEN